MADLTTLENVKTFLGISNGDDDATLSRLISTASAEFLRMLGGRIIPAESITERQSGTKYGRTIFPEQYPVLSVTSVTIDDETIPARSAIGDDGWVLHDDVISLIGYTTTPGSSNIVILYDAGFAVEDEEATVTSDGAEAPATTYAAQAAEYFVEDRGVTYADGTAMTKVTSGPAEGEYAVSATGLYTFAAADEDEAILISYSTIPHDIEQAVIDLVAWRFRGKEHIGQFSSTTAGATTQWLRDQYPPGFESVVDAYRARSA